MRLPQKRHNAGPLSVPQSAAPQGILARSEHGRGLQNYFSLTLLPLRDTSAIPSGGPLLHLCTFGLIQTGWALEDELFQ